MMDHQLTHQQPTTMYALETILKMWPVAKSMQLGLKAQYMPMYLLFYHSHLTESTLNGIEVKDIISLLPHQQPLTTNG